MTFTEFGSAKLAGCLPVAQARGGGGGWGSTPEMPRLEKPQEGPQLSHHTVDGKNPAS